MGGAGGRDMSCLLGRAMAAVGSVCDAPAGTWVLWDAPGCGGSHRQQGRACCAACPDVIVLSAAPSVSVARCCCPWPALFLGQVRLPMVGSHVQAERSATAIKGAAAADQASKAAAVALPSDEEGESEVEVRSRLSGEG